MGRRDMPTGLGDAMPQKECILGSRFNVERNIGFLVYDVARLLRRGFDRRVCSLG